jgi:hypothetical protein
VRYRTFVGITKHRACRKNEWHRDFLYVSAGNRHQDVTIYRKKGVFSDAHAHRARGTEDLPVFDGIDPT